MSLALWQSIPLACVLLPLGSAALTAFLPGRWARRWCLLALALITGLSAVFVLRIWSFGRSYTYPMGHYPAPWGNELRAGPLEAAAGLVFALVMLLSMLGGLGWLDRHIAEEKHALYCALMLLLCASLQAQVYTNDLFTAYVFIEIMTLAAAVLIAVRSSGPALLAATRYMIMNLIASALFLLGVILLYDLTGHLLMEPIHIKVQELAASGAYHLPLTVVVAVMASGLAIKSALFPFHTWVPGAYGTSTPASAAVLSGLVSKGYIFLLLKVFHRVIGLETIAQTGIGDVLLFFGLAGMICGSVAALSQCDLRRMLAWSSVAQIGYIFAGLGLGTEAGLSAAVVHMLAHAACKSLLFISAGGLYTGESGDTDFSRLSGAALSAPLAGAGFTIGALSIIGLPFLGGFTSKLALAQAAAAIGGPGGWAVLICLILSTLLNVLYFFRALLILWKRGETAPGHPPLTHRTASGLAVTALSLLNFAIGVLAVPLLQLVRSGLGLLD
ncbi:MAG: sodium:proton antiporter [Clostridia bacterium]|nr:sodium:proton antiporter [Clostridia bacterium]